MRSLSDISQKSDSLNSVFKVFCSQQKGAWGIYRPLPGEIDLAWQQTTHIDWYFPRVTNSKCDLQFISRKAGFEEGYAGIWEPKMDSEFEIAAENLQGIFVPGVGFDRNGFRLGRGKGFYDRFLKDFPGLKIGVTFQELILEKVPVEPWDIPMDMLLTDEKMINLMSVEPKG